MFWNNKKKLSPRSQIDTPRTPLAISLEPRMMFDGAVAATAAEATVAASTDASSAHNTDSTAEHLAATPSSTTPEERHEVVFIDASVKDKQQLLDSLVAGTEVVVLDANSDGLKQMADYLNGRSGIDAIHFISHGGEASLQVGSTRLGLDNMANAQSQLSAIGSSLAENGDFLIYGCDTSKGERGGVFVEQLANFTGADIAASNDWTGDTSKGGDWVLETSTGVIETATLFADAGYSNVLNTLNAGDMVVLGWNALNDTITFATLVDIPAGTVLKITDWGWNAAGNAFTGTSTGDGLITWTTSGTISAGTVFNLFLGGAGDGQTTTLTNVTTNTDLSADIAITGYSVADPMNIAGDSVFIYQDSDANPYFIFGMNNSSGVVDANGWNTSIAATLRDSMLPNGAGSQNALNNGTNAIGLPGGASQQDNVQYTGPTSAADRATWLARITNQANWSGSANAVDTTSIGTNTGSMINIALPNSAPSIGNLNGDSVAWSGEGNTVRLDVGSNANLADAELGALNSGNGNWSGASLLIQRNGTAVSSDVLGFDTVGALFTVSGSNLQSGGLTFATFTNTGGVLTITFTSSSTTATTALVNDVAQRITYRNDTPSGDATIRFTLHDGNSAGTAAYVTVTSDTIYVTNTTDTATINVSDGVSFSEAIAIAAADSTGTQTIVFSSSLAGQTVSASAATSLGESLTLSLYAASGVTLNGGSFSIGSGSVLTTTNGTGDTATISTTLTGAGGVVKSGAGTVTLSGSNNTYSGGTTISAGTLAVNGGSALLDDGAVSVAAGAGLTLSSNEEIGSLSGAGTVTVGSGVTLTVGNDASATFSGSLTGAGGLTISQSNGNTNVLTLTGDNSGLTGQVRLVNYGRLTVNGENAINDNAAVTVNANGILTLQSNQTIGSLASNSAAASIVLGSHTLTTGGNNTSTTFAGVMSGTGSLVKQGSGTWTLGATNIYSGTTTVSGGTLSIASDGNLGGDTVTLAAGTVLAVTGATTIDNAIVLSGNATVSNSANATLSGGISGAHTLTKSGSGTLTLSGTNSYSDTTANAGTLSVAGDANLGSGVLTLDGATFNVTANSSAIDNAIVIGSGGGTFNKASGTLTLSGSLSGAGSITKTGAGQLTHSGSGTLTLDGATITNSSSGVTMILGSNIVLGSSGGTFDLTGGDITLNGNISGSGSLTRQGGAGYLWLAGNNSHTGTQFVTSGWLVAASATAFGTGQIILSGGTTLGFNAGIASLANNIVLAGNVTLQNANPNSTLTTLTGVISESGGSRDLTVRGGTGTNNAIVLAGTNTYTGTTTLATGTLQITNADNISSAGITLGPSGANFNISGSNVTLSNNINLTGSATISNANAVTLSGVISGSTTLAKSGIGTLTLSGSNSNTGTTTVSAGTLEVDGSTSSATTVASGATLAGSGTLGGDVTVQSGGTLAPGGAGVGTLTVNGNLTLASGSTLALNINGVTAGTGYDRVVVNGNVDVSGATLAVTQGYAAGTGDSYTVIVNDAADAVTGTFSGVSEGSTFNAAGNGTELTTSYIGGSGNDLTLTAPTAPTITNVSSNTANGTYKIGEVITVNVQFDSAVNVTGTPTLTLETGANDRVLSYVSGSGSNTLTFSYTIQAGDTSTDLDYVSSSALSLNGGTIKDGANQNAILTLAPPGTAGSLGANKALVVDSVRPAATSITLSDTSLRIGETATATITFSEAVTGLTLADFTAANGVLSNLSTSDNITWTATFTPSSNVSDATNLITLDNTGVQDQVGNTGAGTTDSSNYAIDTQRPTAAIVVSDTTLKAGQTTTVTITFTEAVTGLGVGDFLVGNGTLSGLSSSDGGITWTATLTPSASVTDTSNLVTLDNTGVQDLAGNAGTGSTDSNNYAIDTQRPTAAIVVSDTALKAGQTTTVTITFSEAVTGLTATDFAVANGALSNLISNDGGLTWTATLTPAANVTDSTNVIILNNAGYTDLAGNAGLGTTDSNNYAIDSKAPAVTSVGVPANGTYVAGDTLDFTVNFDEAVTVDTTGGIPRLAITLDTGGTVYASYLSGSGSSALVFRLTVANGQMDSNGISLGSSIDANNGTLRDSAGNNSTPPLNAVGSTTGVLVDAVAPQVSTISLDSASPTNASSVTFTVTFSENVSGMDLGDFSLLTTGSANGNLVSLVQLSANTYRITVDNVSGQGNLGLALAANGSGIVDANNNALAVSFSTPGYAVGTPTTTPTLLPSGDPQLMAYPAVTAPPPTAPLPPVSEPGMGASDFTSPLLPPPLFEVRTIGGDLPLLGTIFLGDGSSAPSFIAQVFGSSDTGLGGTSGFLGFGGGDGGIFGSSTLAGIFSEDVPGVSEMNVFDGTQWKQSDLNQGLRGVFGVPTFGQQLHDLHEGKQRQVRELAQALGQLGSAQPQA